MYQKPQREMNKQTLAFLGRGMLDLAHTYYFLEVLTMAIAIVSSVSIWSGKTH
jgi:hypothetical protein